MLPGKLWKLEERARDGINHHPLNLPNEDEARSRLLSVGHSRLAGCHMDANIHSSILAVCSLVVRPDKEVNSILTLSKLSRQAQQYKLQKEFFLTHWRP